MDTGHYNCRDYYISPHFAPTTVVTDRTLLPRHETWQQLEERSRSPVKPAFPLLKLPLELRQKIYGYLLPRTLEHRDGNPLASHARNFSAVQKRGARGMILPQNIDTSQKGPTHLVWQRGNIRLLSASRQLHDECAEIIYGANTFLLFVTFSGISFRYSWMLKAGLTPTRQYPFLELLPKRYLALIKRVIVNIDHVDSYTSMIKFNVSGKGLAHGLRKQVERLVIALQPVPNDPTRDLVDQERRLTKIRIQVSNGNPILDQIKSDVARKREGKFNNGNAMLDQTKSEVGRQRDGKDRVSEDLEAILDPFGNLRGVRNVQITGAVTKSFSESLATKMMSTEMVDAAILARSAFDVAAMCLRE